MTSMTCTWPCTAIGLSMREGHMDNSERDLAEHIGKLDDLNALAVTWQQLYETSQKKGNGISVEEAKKQSGERYAEAALVLATMAHSELVSTAAGFLFEKSRAEWRLKCLASEKKLVREQRELIRQRLDGLRVKASKRGAKAADVRHGKPGGSRDKAKEIRDIWLTGKYSSRDVCAEQECAALSMSFSAARKALRNTPDPSR